GFLENIPWWNFIDWTKTFDDGTPPQTEKGESPIISLRFAAALREAADIEEHFGIKQNAEHYRKLAGNIINNAYKTCWDDNKGMLADTPEKTSFSQHANIWAILLDVIPKSGQKAVFEKIISDTNVTQCSYYYQFYLHLALKKVGFGDKYLKLLRPWKEMIDLGLTTVAETPEPSRSDCHPWNAHPNFNLLSIVCGIEPSAPGFKKVNISPNLSTLNWAKGKVPTPSGIIAVDYKKMDKDGLKVVIQLPKGITGTFNWKGNKIELKEGKQTFTID
ncbi:alpha-L-rhamnosidase, partial [bacterium]|nr:alpha-L-rhamnosidase [bacterium]